MRKINFYNLGKIMMFVLVIGIIFTLNHYNGRIVDDLGYSNIDHPLQKAVWEYFNWNGRSIGEFLAFGVLLKLPSLLIDVLNTVALALLLWAMEYLTSFKQQNYYFNVWRYALLFAMTLVFAVTPGQDFFWTTGSANYLYTSLFALTAIVIFFKEYNGKNIRRPKWLNVLVMPLGLLAGWSTENMGGTVILAGLVFGGLAWFRYKRVPLTSILLLIPTLVGYLVMILAPGNAIRANGAVRDTLKNIQGLFNFASDHYFIIVLIYFVTLALTVLYSISRHTVNIANVGLVGGSVFGLLGFANYFALMLSPIEVPARAHIGFILLLSVAITLMLSDSMTGNAWGMLPLLATVFIALQFIIQIVPGIIATRSDNHALQARYDYVASQKSAGNNFPVVSTVDNESMSKFYGGYQLWDIRGEAFARFIKDGYRQSFGIQDITGVMPEQFNAFYRNGDVQFIKIQSQKIYEDALSKSHARFIKFGINNGEPYTSHSPSIKLDTKNYTGTLISTYEGNHIEIQGNAVTLVNGPATLKFAPEATNYILFDKSGKVIKDVVSFVHGSAVRGQ